MLAQHHGSGPFVDDNLGGDIDRHIQSFDRSDIFDDSTVKCGWNGGFHESGVHGCGTPLSERAVDRDPERLLQGARCLTASRVHAERV